MRPFWLVHALVLVTISAVACGGPTTPPAQVEEDSAADPVDSAGGTDATASNDSTTDASPPDTIAATDDGTAPDAVVADDTDTATAMDTDIATAVDTAPDIGPDVADVADVADTAPNPDTTADADTAVPTDIAPELPPECTAATDCDDGVGCTDDTCSGGVCVHTANNAHCDDANVCTDNVCDLTADCTATTNTLACDDGNECSGNDVCVAGTCTGTKIACPGTVCGNGVVEKGEDCDYAGADSVCCGKTTCGWLATSSAEVEPNNSAYGKGTLSSNALASAPLATEVCGQTATAAMDPDWQQNNYDLDYFKVYIGKPGTVTFATVDPTGGTGCQAKTNATNGKYLLMRTQVYAFRVSPQGQLSDLGSASSPSNDDGCAKISVDVATPGWVYLGVYGGGEDEAYEPKSFNYGVTVSQTVWSCGDGVRKGSEACEGTDLNKQTCLMLGYTSGALSCQADCTLDKSQCEGLPPGVEPNNDIASATPMGNVAIGRFGGGIDYYAVTVAQGSTVVLTTSDPSGKNACGSATFTSYDPDLDTVLSIYAQDGTLLASHDDINKQYPPYPEGTNFCSTLTLDVPVGGTFFVGVSGHSYLKIPGSNVPWGYQLDVQVTPWTCTAGLGLPCEATGNQSPATAMPVDAAVQGIVTAATGADYFQFSVSGQATPIRLSLGDGGTGACGTPVMPVVMELFAADGTTLLGTGAATDDGNGCPLLEQTLPVGDYVVRVSSADAAVAFAYQLFVSRGTSMWVTAAAGGTVTLPSTAAAAGASVLIPPGALYQDVTITVFDGTPVALDGMDPQGPPVQFGPSGLGFVLPVTITLPLATAETETAALVVLHRNDATGQVEPQEVLSPVMLGFVSTLANSFSTYQPAKATLPILLWSGSVFEETAANDGQIAPLAVKIVGGKFAPQVKNGKHSELFGTVVGDMSLGYCNLSQSYIGGTGVLWVADDLAAITVWHVSPYSGSDMNVGPFTCEFNSVLGDGNGGTLTPFVDLQGQPVETAKVVGYSKKNLYLSYLDPPSVELSGTVLKQSKLADGTFPSQILVTIKGDKLKAPVGSALSAVVPGQSGSNRFSSAVVSGLTAKTKVVSPTLVEVWLEGMANAPLAESGTVPLTLTLAKEDFKGQGMPQINPLALTIDWSVKKMHWSRFVFHEDADQNDGSIVTQSTLTLVGDEFAAAPGTVIGTGTGLPDGLQLQITVNSATTATAKILGKASDPLTGNWDDWTQPGAQSSTFGVAFADADFVGGVAADVVRANRTDLELVLFGFQGFVYTGLPGGGHQELEAYDFGAGPRFLYWQPMMAEGGLTESLKGTNPCKIPGACEVKNFGHEDRLAFKLTSGANPHSAQHGGNKTGCSDDGGSGGNSECTPDKWYPIHNRTRLRGIGATQAILVDTTKHWQDFSADGKILPPNPDRIGKWEQTPGGFLGTCAYNETCCGFDNPSWLQHDVGYGIPGYSGPFGSWVPDPIQFGDAWNPLAGWGWDFGAHPLVGGPTDKYELNWIGGNGMQMAIVQQIECPDVRLVAGKRVDLCEGTGYQFQSLIYAAETLIGFPLSWTTNCTGPWANPSSKCLPMFDYQTGHSACYGAPTGAPTGGNYPRFY